MQALEKIIGSREKGAATIVPYVMGATLLMR